ncbi:MAG: transglutaminase-like domain-containing protein [Planctomycetota bacterium]|nr:transglutaminase-like domain-containing protein [Planctomycetota bacterium]
MCRGGWGGWSAGGWFAALAAGLLLCASAALPGTAMAAHQEVWVSTDRSVDCSSLDTIIRDVIKPGMTDEQKVLALFNFYREHVFHFFVTPDGDHTLKLLNILGYTLCGSQAATSCELLRKAGFEARVVCWPNGAHTFYEVKYDGKWHALDTMTNFYVYTRGEDRHIASMEELKADPTLATKAVEEKRACPGFLMCGDPAVEFTKGFRAFDRKAKATPYNPKELRLCRGMEFIRFWSCCDRPCPGSFDPKYVGPLHACGARDEKSEENFHNWEPYLVRNMGTKVKSYRHWGSGRVLYSPDFRRGDHLDGALTVENLAAGRAGEPALHPAAAGKEAIWCFEIRTSYYLTECMLHVKGARKAEADTLKAEISFDDGKTWTPAWKAEGTGPVAAAADLSDLVAQKCPGRFAYRMRFVMQASGGPADVGLDAIFLRTSFQHNMMAAPRLRPGKNRVTVEAKPAEGAEFVPFDVVYRWQAGPDWDRAEVREFRWRIEKSPATFEADLPELEGNRQHRMKSLAYRCGELAWRPDPPPPLPISDFAADAGAVAAWKAGEGISLSHDGKGMLIKASAGGKYPAEIVRDGLDLDVSAQKYLFVDFENPGGSWRGLETGVIAGGNRIATPWLVYSNERPGIKIPLTYFKNIPGKVQGVFVRFPKAPQKDEEYRLYSVRFQPWSYED